MNEFLTQFNQTAIVAAVAVILITPWLISRVARQGTATAVTLFGLLAMGVFAAAIIQTSQTNKKPSKEVVEKQAPKPDEGSSGSGPEDKSKPQKSAEASEPEASPTSRSIAPRANTSDPWDEIPVFYGTHHAREDIKEPDASNTKKRIGYGEKRGRRLEVGRALVTVPKSHKVPNIERPWVYKLPFASIVIYSEKEDPAKHFTLRELKDL